MKLVKIEYKEKEKYFQTNSWDKRLENRCRDLAIEVQEKIKKHKEKLRKAKKEVAIRKKSKPINGEKLVIKQYQFALNEQKTKETSEEFKMPTRKKNHTISVPITEPPSESIIVTKTLKQLRKKFHIMMIYFKMMMKY
jgi:hypothetical protein